MDTMTNLEKVKTYNKAYRLGDALISDNQYDTLYDRLSEDEKREVGVGHVVEEIGRKQKLPHQMRSMEKLKEFKDISKWITSKDIPKNTLFVLSPKYDGLSFTKDYDSNECYTRGDGLYGQRSDEHYNMLQGNQQETEYVKELSGNYTIGEVIMPKYTFHRKYSETFKNPRNLVAGLFNNKTAKRELEDVVYVTYGVSNEVLDKVDTLELLNRSNFVEVPYLVGTIDIFTEELLTQYYKKWSEDFEIDGLIIEINDRELREELGRERNNNPVYARGVKIFESESLETTINHYTKSVSKDGRISIVGCIDPISVGGVLISNVTLNNFRMVQDNKWGIGAKVSVCRSGDVIPLITETIEPVEAVIPTNCHSCNGELSWCSNNVQLLCTNKECPERRMSEIESFMTILGIENVGEGVISKLYSHGMTTIKSILEATESDFLKVEGFQKRKASLVYKSIHKKLVDVELCKLQHAMNLFPKLGSKKLKLLESYNTKENIPNSKEIVSIEGFSTISSDIYLNGIEQFWEDVSMLPITIKKPEVLETVGEVCKDMVIVFTGVRAKELEVKIVEQGGKVGSSVSGKTTHLVCKERGSNSGKTAKARDLGCVIMELEDLQQLLKNV
jgi:DNA ligase (NAD+)